VKRGNGNTALPPLRPMLKSTDDLEFVALAQKVLRLADALEATEARLLALERKKRKGG